METWWKNCGKWWEVVEKLWKNCGKVVEEWWKGNGNVVENQLKSMKINENAMQN